ncbi:uncharacterized protein LOC117270487 isoform X2 [Epinephelus lanceolatus]
MPSEFPHSSQSPDSTCSPVSRSPVTLSGLKPASFSAVGVRFSALLLSCLWVPSYSCLDLLPVPIEHQSCIDDEQGSDQTVQRAAATQDGGEEGGKQQSGSSSARLAKADVQLYIECVLLLIPRVHEEETCSQPAALLLRKTPPHSCHGGGGGGGGGRRGRGGYEVTGGSWKHYSRRQK